MVETGKFSEALDHPPRLCQLAIVNYFKVGKIMSDSGTWGTFYTDDTRQTIISRTWLRYDGEDEGFEGREVTDPDNWVVVSEGPGEQPDTGFLLISHVRRR